MVVNNWLEMEHITNLFGVIRGREEPDRYIIIGSHYDAWSFGATDPNSGTAVLMEVARAFAQLKKDHGNLILWKIFLNTNVGYKETYFSQVALRH